ncbi:hypothetical protein COT62_02705 [Candidatus Roizmanbacteria bacterium CG09_land_8_20_14_0_10_41_9]|uniref:Uncharacterized protein n=1 Tax=Candidatus Roizmanbacteria bacterium CG09_land_8_20_14_0_10_41_9 TaxID=1974850 RepID=A0A2H0WSM4_9BACT|nr:MAG: hypothetical protein COT62_02705 [Candidatus Roizmanbacteria bacterium CG09_land_8_20_14_0_10_41_9]
MEQSVTYLYVILETPEYAGRACFHGDGAKEHDNFELYIDDLNLSLNETDKKKLKDDIIKRPLNGELKKEISKIQL